MRKATALKEAGPACAFFTRAGRSAVFATKNLPRALEVSFARCRRHAFRGFVVHASGAQVPADARRTVFARQLTRALLGVALVRELLSRDQRVEQFREPFRGPGVRRELACEFGAAVLAAREQP